MLKSIVAALALAFVAPAIAHAQYGVPGVRVQIAPPAPRIEVQPPRPSPQHQFINGHWAWRGGRHEWMQGHWALPPGPGYRWEPARWADRNGSWEFFEGHWAYAGQPVETVVEQPVAAPIVVQQAPPAEIVETIAPAPYAGGFWVKGHWYWSGVAWQWAGGHWEHPRAGYVWEHPHWQPGPGGRYTFVAGRWRR